MRWEITWATPLYFVLLVVLGLKAVHTVFVILWLLRHGNAVATAAGNLDRTAEHNARAFRDAMIAAGADRPTGIMRFGIKDMALTEWLAAAKGHHRLKWLWWTAIRGGWHILGVASLSVVALFIGAYIPVRLPVVDRDLLFMIGETMIAIMFWIGVEMVVLMITMGRWLPYYHRLAPARLIAHNAPRVRETVSLIVACAGASIITLAVMTGMLAFASRRTEASTPAISDNLGLGILEALARAIKVLGTVGDGVEAQTAAGALLTITLLPLVLTYIAFIVPIAASVVEAGRSAPVRRTGARAVFESGQAEEPQPPGKGDV